MLDRTSAGSFSEVEGSAFGTCGVVIFSTASVVYGNVRSLGGLCAIVRMTSLADGLFCFQDLAQQVWFGFIAG